MKTFRCKHCKEKHSTEIEIIMMGVARFCSKGCRRSFTLEQNAKKREKEQIKKEKAKKKKATSPKVLYKKNVDMAKLIAKIRDNYICQWCWFDWRNNKSKIHGSHIINEARDHRLATNEYNIKALCYRCHMNLWHKDPVLASEWFNKKFPWRYDELQAIYIENIKGLKIPREWHIQENERLKLKLKELWKN